MAPHAWTGSVAILERYLTNGGRPVEYGQCWVFSGLVVTICRALGEYIRYVNKTFLRLETGRWLQSDVNFLQVFLADLLQITSQHMIQMGLSLLTNSSTKMAMKYRMDRMKTAMTHAGTSMFGTMFGCNDQICRRVRGIKLI